MSLRNFINVYGGDDRAQKFYDRAQKFYALARSFHCLEECPEDLFLPSFNPPAFDSWVVRNFYDELACNQVGAFIRDCFNRNKALRGEPTCGDFDLFTAFQVWDSRHIAAFQAWVRNPWRP